MTGNAAVSVRSSAIRGTVYGRELLVFASPKSERGTSIAVEHFCPSFDKDQDKATAFTTS